ncbi:futalosine hydrolase [Jidongwangia harbinensis]|uniref:futalosine hydrolase n=1 Tax=Jidongwangia harbinensis TaxID=2878561 RepID=UPI001CD94750|nr:futalosine hydrolase [Jidongwangia harbinensis]MCA2214517.1 futalosine hydrolase [Jidongwangia harbinensis]
MRRLLVVTAVPAEADAIRAGDQTAGATPAKTHPTRTGDRAAAVTTPAKADAIPAGDRKIRVTVAAVGVGSAVAAAGTARLLALAEAGGDPFHAVISAGIAGGFPGRAEVGATVVGTRSVAADLGAETPDGFRTVDQLGFGTSHHDTDKDLRELLRSALPTAVVGDILTLATVTGTAVTADRLAVAHPDAAAEAMEGYGVACAAAGAGVPFAELRTISNLVGPRDRAAWRIPEALAALTAAASAAFILPG